MVIKNVIVCNNNKISYTACSLS